MTLVGFNLHCSRGNYEGLRQYRPAICGGSNLELQDWRLAWLPTLDLPYLAGTQVLIKNYINSNNLTKELKSKLESKQG